jgi:hypothetical protein
MGGNGTALKERGFFTVIYDMPFLSGRTRVPGEQRENKPKPGSVSEPDIQVNTGKPQHILLFCSCGE